MQSALFEVQNMEVLEWTNANTDSWNNYELSQE